MYKKLRKLTALLIAGTLAIAGSLLPASADGASFSGGTGTASDPYLISTADDLVALSELSLGDNAANYVGKAYKVTANINMTGVTKFKGIGWGNRFSGIFDGNEHIIKNLTFTSDGFAGFFNLADGAAIKNLGLENITISGNVTQGMGGFIGRNFKDKGYTTIENCFTRNITLNNSNGSNNTGAFVGNEAVAGIILKNCYSTGLAGAGIQGLVGNNYGAPQGGSTISNCYSQIQPWSKFGTADPENTTNVYRISESSQLTDDIWAGLGSAFSADVNNVNNGLPVLAWETKIFSGGSGTATDPYLISTAADLVELSELSKGTSSANYLNKAYKVTADIDLNNNSGFAGIGGKFVGTFDGDCHVIKNVTVSTGGQAGFFIATDNAVIKNLGLENITLNGSAAMGGISGRNVADLNGGATTIENCFVRGLTLTTTDTNSNHKGGLIGQANVVNLVMKNCYSSNLSGVNFGIVGNQYGAIEGTYTMTNVYSTLNVSNAKNATNTYQISSSATAEQLAGLGSAFSADVNNENNGLPVLAWETKIFSGGTGTATDPYLISSADDLVELSELSKGTSSANYLNKAYKVTADIDLNNNSGFAGIGGKFVGTFDGDCHVIKNVTVSTGGQAGFFIATDNATIKNLGLENITLNGSAAMGGISGRNVADLNGGATTIENCFVRGLTLTTTDTNPNHKGGLVGQANVVNLVMKNCYSSNLSGVNYGIVGNQYGAIEGTYTMTNVYSTLNVSNAKNATNTYQISSSEYLTNDIMDCLMPEFAADTNNVNSGLPVLAWEEVLSLAITDGKAEVINNSAAAATGVLAIAAYDSSNTMLEVCATKDVSVNADGRDELSYTAVDGAKYYKVFLWKDMTDLAPLCGTATLTK